MEVVGDQVTVKGPKGVIGLTFRADRIRIEVNAGEVRVLRDSDEKIALSLHGLTRSLVANAVIGVTEGFSKNLEVHGVGFRVELSGQVLTMNIGFSHAVVYEAPEGIELATPNATGGAQAHIVVSGIDKQMVGQTAADIREKRKPEPYKGKGIRYQNEVIHWKAGKTAVS